MKRQGLTKIKAGAPHKYVLMAGCGPGPSSGSVDTPESDAIPILDGFAFQCTAGQFAQGESVDSRTQDLIHSREGPVVCRGQQSLMCPVWHEKDVGLSLCKVPRQE